MATGSSCPAARSSHSLPIPLGTIILGRLLLGLGLPIVALKAAASSDDPAAGSGWRKQEPIPTPWYFADVDMVSTTEGWAVSHPITGDHANIFHTTNGGRKWSLQGPLFRQLNGVSFIDNLHGVTVGNEYRYTLDGGVTWLQGTTNNFGTAYDVELVDQNTAYACGFGAVTKTTDGGKTWISHSVPLQGNFVGIDFVNTNTGWIVGDEGSVYKTNDGAGTWIRQRHDNSQFYTGVSFVSDLEGWVCGNSTILHTTDGGTTWVTQPIPSGADATEVRFLDSQNGWAAGILRTILHTVDGGNTWVLQLGGVFEEPNNRYPFNGLDVTSPTTAIAVGGGNSIYTSTNAGTRWVSRGSGSGTVSFRFARTDANHLWAANSNSEVLYTVNGGKKWERTIIQLQLDCETCSNTADIAFLNNSEGWAVINGLFTTTSWIWHSLDGGKTWQSLFVTNTGPLSGLAIVDSQTLVAVSGTDDLIFRSTDAGITWESVSHPRGGSWFGAVRFVSGTQTGWTVGEGGKILKSSDGGATWISQRDASHPLNLIDVSFADVSNGWAVGGEELHTTDGGATWVKQRTGITGSVSVYALSPTVAWIGGLEDLGRTTDGGVSWTIERPSNTDWFAINFLDSDNGWAGGQDQEIDDVPGSIWKRTGTAAEQFTNGPASSIARPLWRQTPPSAGALDHN
jgi:photosystem II stability/assembly factor-like uncharacterized protein